MLILQIPDRMKQNIIQLPKAQATIVDPREKTIKHVPIEEIQPSFIDSLNLDKCYYEEHRTNFYSSTDETLESWTFEDKEVKQTFYGITYILGLRIGISDDEEYFLPPRIHQRYISNYISFK